jgi:hypothetical protein
MANTLSLQWQGKQYDLDLDKVTSRQWDQVEIHTRLVDEETGALIEQGLTAGDVLVFVGVGSKRGVSGRMGKALLWLFKSQAGDPAVFEDDMPVLQFYEALATARIEAAAAAAAEKAAQGDGAGETAPKEGSTPSSRSGSRRKGSSSAS